MSNIRALMRSMDNSVDSVLPSFSLEKHYERVPEFVASLEFRLFEIMGDWGFEREWEQWNKDGVTINVDMEYSYEWGRPWRYPIKVHAYYDSIVGRYFDESIPIITMLVDDTDDVNTAVEALDTKKDELKALVDRIHAGAVKTAPDKWEIGRLIGTAEYIHEEGLFLTKHKRLARLKKQATRSSTPEMKEDSWFWREL